MKALDNYQTDDESFDIIEEVVADSTLPFKAWSKFNRPWMFKRPRLIFALSQRTQLSEYLIKQAWSCIRVHSFTLDEFLQDVLPKLARLVVEHCMRTNKPFFTPARFPVWMYRHILALGWRLPEDHWTIVGPNGYERQVYSGDVDYDRCLCLPQLLALPLAPLQLPPYVLLEIAMYLPAYHKLSYGKCGDTVLRMERINKMWARKFDSEQ